ncbi:MULTISPECIES: hypothetical protein [unclassified Streptomyces]|jgi:ABC-type uncharacterized transport system permease subunit|uniref:hypothetical protein n=1 Tax=unclassified Streptomyces TaxID=2593676 RepID=UPI0029A38469|nr:hypothetical protein [Streptomyces sp. ME18-1-4]MDX3248818.1 hypothetical protein [Streptomyces sp. ME18-1-4]
MNTLKGLGACAVLAGIAYAVTKVATTDQMVTGFTVTVVALSVIGYMAALRRKSKDRRAARGRAKSRRAAS